MFAREDPSRDHLRRPIPGPRADPSSSHDSPLDARHLLGLQRLAGNAAVARLFSPAAPHVQRCGTEVHEGCACAERGKGPVVQRAKIDFGDLAWSDFKGAPPAKFPAATYSGMHPVPTKKLIRVDEAETVVGCILGKKPAKEVDATVSIDSATLNEVKAYMWQEGSGVNPDYKVGLKAKTAAVVKACEADFAKGFKSVAKQAAKECAKQVKECKAAFASGSTEFTLSFDARDVTATSAKDCAVDFNKACKDAFSADNIPTDFKFEVTTKSKACPKAPVTVLGTATAPTQADCKGLFKTEVDELHKAESHRLLAHEQLHFNITHKFAEDLRGELNTSSVPLAATAIACGSMAAVAKAKKAFNKLKAPNALNKEWDKAEKTRAKTQDEYDVDTCHGLDIAAQAAWAGKF